MENKRKRIGIFGGTFDPPHIGHLIMAEQARAQLQLDTILFVPASIPPHKPNGTSASAEQRLKMLRFAIKGNRAFAVSGLELKRKGISYTVDTLRELCKKYSGAELYLIVGADNFAQFGTWKSPDQILGMVTLAVYDRPGFNLDNVARPSVPCIRLKSARIEVSSSAIRLRVRQGKPIRYLVPAEVEKFIQKNRLYTD